MRPTHLSALPLIALVACTSTRMAADVPRMDEGTRTRATGTSVEYESVVVNPLAVHTLPGGLEPALAAVEGAYAALGLVPGRARGEMAGSLRVGVRDVVLRGRFAGSRMSALLDCGMGVTGPNADAYRVSLTVWSDLVPADGETQMQTRVSAEAQSVEGANRPPVGCVSTGRIEQRLAVEAGTRLARTLYGDTTPVASVPAAAAAPAGAERSPAAPDDDRVRGLAVEALAGIAPSVEHRRYGDNIPAYEIAAEFGPFEIVRFHGGLVLFDVSDACTRDDAAQLG